LPRKSEILGTKKKETGPPCDEPTRASRRYVWSMASVGLTQEEMAGVLEVSVETLVKHYVAELATAAAAANDPVGKSLWLQAVGGPKKDWSTPIDMETGLLYAQIAASHSKGTTLKRIPRKPPPASAAQLDPG
jgi:hypothetical protein